MNDLTPNFGTLYHPVKTLVVYQRQGQGNQNPTYVESYDMDYSGCPINGHPLTIKEGNELAKALTITEKKPNNFLNPKGLLPKNVLSLKSGSDGFAVWHTPAQRMPLLFIKDLDIPCGKANISALLWKATKNSLQVFAVTDEEINEETPLFYAPFFNTYETGRVCMGNVPICIPKDCGLEMFMQRWDEYFFNSYFSHLFNGHQPVKGNIIQLWKSLVNTKRKFPIKSLIQTKYQLKNLLP